MTHLDHNRPELRLKDNLRREFTKAASFSGLVVGDVNWPAFMHPVSESPKALTALLQLLTSLVEWADDQSAEFVLSEPPVSVVERFRSFAQHRISAPYIDGLTGEDWLTEPIGGNRHTADFRPALIALRTFCQ